MAVRKTEHSSFHYYILQSVRGRIGRAVNSKQRNVLHFHAFRIEKVKRRAQTNVQGIT